MKKIGLITTIKSKWLNIYCEKWLEKGNEIEYWRVEKDSSLIVISESSDSFILPRMQFRPGIGKKTLDFPGGRIKKGDHEENVVRLILTRELGIEYNQIISIKKLSVKHSIINSSFNNQELIVFSALIKTEENTKKLLTFKKNKFKSLLRELDCLQCNYALRLWLDLEIRKDET